MAPLINIRRLIPQDAIAYRDLILYAYQHYPEAFTSSYAERSGLPSTFWEARLSIEDNPKDAVFGAWVGNQLVGIAGLSVETREKTRHKGTLFGMFVSEQHRRQGLGRDGHGLHQYATLPRSRDCLSGPDRRGVPDHGTVCASLRDDLHPLLRFTESRSPDEGSQDRSRSGKGSHSCHGDAHVK